MTRAANQIFGINTIEDYLAFCGQAVSALADKQHDVVRGFAAILALNHIPDWVHHKLSGDQRGKLGLADAKDESAVKHKLESTNPDLVLVRGISNGFKHLRPVHSTKVIAGYGRGPYGIGPFGVPYLLIDLGEDRQPEERWDVGLALCERTLKWWRQILEPIL